MENLSGALTTVVQTAKHTGEAIYNNLPEVGPVGKTALLFAVNLSVAGAQSDQNCSFRDAYRNLTPGEQTELWVLSAGALAAYTLFATGIASGIGYFCGRRVIECKSDVTGVGSTPEKRPLNQATQGFSPDYLYEGETSSVDERYHLSGKKSTGIGYTLPYDSGTASEDARNEALYQSVNQRNQNIMKGEGTGYQHH